MTVGTFDQPDFEAQSATAYKTAIDNSVAVVGEVAGQFAPHEAGTPDMTIVVDAGRLFVDGVLVVRSQQITDALVAPVTHPRIDRIVMTELTGVISVLAGTEAAIPEAPAIASGKLPICQVALDTITTAITNDLITDERIGSGGKILSEASGIPIGVGVPFAGENAPDGWLLCYGQAISRTTYADLFTALGTRWGAGDGSSTFNLPDMRGRVPAGKDNMGGVTAGRIYNTGDGNPGIAGTTLGAVGGAARHLLTTAQVPAHTHTVSVLKDYATYPMYFAKDPISGAGYTSATVTSSSSGGGGYHPNCQPTSIWNYIIYTGVIV